MEYQSCHAIIVKVEPSHLFGCKLTCYTLEHGWIFLYATKQAARRTGFDPLAEYQCLIYKKRSEHLYLHEAELLDSHLSARLSYSSLSTLFEITRLLHTHQPHGKIAPELYLLLRAFLRGIHQLKNPRIALVAFIAKILNYEGSFDPDSQPDDCPDELWVKICEIAYIKKFNALDEVVVSDELINISLNLIKSI